MQFNNFLGANYPDTAVGGERLYADMLSQALAAELFNLVSNFPYLVFPAACGDYVSARFCQARCDSASNAGCSAHDDGDAAGEVE